MESPSILGSAVKASPSICRASEKAADAVEEVAQALLVEHVAERQHRHAVGHLAEGLDRRRADLQRGTVVADEMGKARLDLFVARAQRVVCGVGDLRLVVAVIELVVMGDRGGEPCKLGGGFGLVERDNGLVFDEPCRLEPFFAFDLLMGFVIMRVRLMSRSAALRASSVMVWPASMRAISSRRCSPSSTATRVAIASPSGPRTASLAISRWPAGDGRHLRGVGHRQHLDPGGKPLPSARRRLPPSPRRRRRRPRRRPRSAPSRARQARLSAPG